MLDNLKLGYGASTVEILKKLLSKKNIEMKTDLNDEQIRVLFLSKWFALCEANPETAPDILLDEALQYLLQLRVSKGRLSRTETYDAIADMKKPEIKDSPIVSSLGKK